MKLFQHTKYRTSQIVILLWSLIFAKCFALEYFVQVYTVPINSALYVWSLTLLMATTATVVFLRLRISQECVQHIQRQDLFIWGTCSATILLTIVLIVQSQRISNYILPALFAIMLGTAYISHGCLKHRHIHIFSGIGWWIGASGLLLFGPHSAKSLFLFAALIIVLTSVPTLLQILKK